MTILTEAELIELAEQIKAERPDISPLDLMTRLSRHMLASAIPERREALLAGDLDRAAETFALEMLRLNDKPASMFLGEEQQEKHYGGIEPLLFGIQPEGLFEHYARMIRLADSPPAPDPLWD